MKACFLSFAILALFASAGAVPWPIAPFDSMHTLGNNWGEYQEYGTGPYYHNGIDIITVGQQGADVHAVRHGWVKAWGTIQYEYHYRLAICDTSSDVTGRQTGWLYAHIDSDRTHKAVGDEVQVGDLIGYLVPWPVPGFDHCHFARISDTGATWNRFPEPTWWFIENPLLELTPNADLVPPVFENARTSQRFAFCRNDSSTYQQPTNLSGDLDIIARVYDKTGYTTTAPTWDKLVPYQMDYMIRSAGGTVVVPWTMSFQFSNVLAPTNDSLSARLLYKRDNTCYTLGDYDAREYYFIITNTDGDSIIELSDAAGAWASESTADGDYWVIARALDVSSNTTYDSMLVTTNNGVTAVAEQVRPVLSQPLSVTPGVTRGPYRIDFGLGQATDVRLRVCDAAGRVVATHASRRLESGAHTATGTISGSGVYVVQLTLGNGDTYTRKLVVIK